MDISDYESMLGGGGIYYGSAGTGNTQKLCEMALKAENPIIVSFTNKATANVKKRLRKITPTSEVECHTFDSYFCEYNGRDIPDLAGKTIFIEEHSMVPNKYKYRGADIDEHYNK